MEEEKKVETQETIKQPEPKVEEPVATESLEVMDESLLAQQPLMAALLENPVPASEPETKVEEPAPAVLQTPVQATEPVPGSIFGIPTETINLSSEPPKEEKVEEEQPQVDLSAYMPPSQSVSVEEVAVKKEKKPSKLPKLIATLLVLVILGVGGWFAYDKIFAGLNPFVKKIDTFEGAISYLEKKIALKPSLESESYFEKRYKADDSVWEVTVVPDMDEKKIQSITLLNKDSDLSKTLSVGAPFLKILDDEKTLNNGVKFAKKHKYSVVYIAKEGVSTRFGKNEEGDAFIDVDISEPLDMKNRKKGKLTASLTKVNEVKINVGDSSIKMKMKDSYSGEKISAVGIDEDLIETVMYTYGEEKIMIMVVNGNVKLKGIADGGKATSEYIKVAGTQGVLYKVGDNSAAIIIRNDFKDADLDDEEEKEYYEIFIEAEDSVDDFDGIIKDVVNCIKKG